MGKQLTQQTGNISPINCSLTLLLFQATVLPICLPWNVTGSQGEPSSKGELVVAAWDRRNDDTAFFASVKSAPVSFMSGEKCKAVPAYNLINTQRHVCAGEPDGKYRAGP